MFYQQYQVTTGLPPSHELPCNHIFEYECTRCRSCYKCDHKFIYNEKLDRWQVRCRDGNIRKIILEKRPEERGRRRGEL